MLKKATMLALLALAPLGAAFADNDVGCGAGTKIWEGQSGVIPKILAATTNGSFGNQTFGISSGTLGCHNGGVVHAEYRVTEFASANLDQLSADMAAGRGETLDALAALYGISDSDRAAFATLAKSHYGEIFAAEHGDSVAVVASLQDLMKSDSRLAHYIA
jgi:hypothetical protein